MEGWAQFFDAEGYAYYHNAVTGETLWEQEYNERLAEQTKPKPVPPPPPQKKNLVVPARNVSAPNISNSNSNHSPAVRLPFQKPQAITESRSEPVSPVPYAPKFTPPAFARPNPSPSPISSSPPVSSSIPISTSTAPELPSRGLRGPQPASEKRAAPHIPLSSSPVSNSPPVSSFPLSSSPSYSAPEPVPRSIPTAVNAKPTATPPATSGDGKAKPIMEQKLKSDFKANYQLKTMGSHISIGLPTQVVQTASFASENFSWALNGSLIMQGELQFERAGDWQTRFCMIEEGQLQLYKSSTDQLAEMSFPLLGCTYDMHLGTNKSHAFKVVKPDGVNLTFACSSKVDFEHWSSAIKINGAKDGPLIQADKAIREKKIKDAERRQEKEYVEAKKKDILTFSPAVRKENIGSKAAAAGLNNPADAQSDVCIEDVSAEQFKIRVTYDSQTWFIYRSEKEMASLYNSLVTSMLSPVRLEHLRGSYPKRMKGQEMRGLIPAYDQCLNAINNERRRIFADKNLRYHYSRFFGPVKMGDTKPPGFILPFEIELA